MGLYAQQAANLSGWSGDYSHDEWRKFRREFEAKLTPLWVRRQIDEIEAELVGERTRREGAERRDRTMQAQIAKEVEVQQALKRERDDAVDEAAKLKAMVGELTQARKGAEAKQAEAQQALKLERDSALDQVAALKATVGELTQARADAEAREAQAQQDLNRERETALGEVAKLRATVDELTRALQRAGGPVSSPQPITQPGQEVYRGHTYVTTEKGDADLKLPSGRWRRFPSTDALKAFLDTYRRF
jgi:septal ring factor EnvC (AmiA/AmiB activator)